MISRLIGFVFVLFSILFLPYWFYAVSLFVVIVIFPFFWEGILLGFLVDIVHGSSTEIAIYALILLIIILPVRENLRVLN